MFFGNDASTDLWKINHGRDRQKFVRQRSDSGRASQKPGGKNGVRNTAGLVIYAVRNKLIEV